MSSLKSYAEIFPPEVMVLGSGVLGRGLGHEDGAFMNAMSLKSDPRELFCTDSAM